MSQTGLFFYNTQTGRKESFVPASRERVTAYLCGPTVYAAPHIGNARPAVVFDVLIRLIRQKWPVCYVSNITDIDDKIMRAAKDTHSSPAAIAQKYEATYLRDIKKLGVIPPDITPRATEHIEPIIAMIQALINKKHAYEAEGHVLFHVPSFDGYGKLSGRSREDMEDGARVEVAPYKKDPRDFVLWKPSDETQPGWHSPWSRGRPGWHIECSAMIHTHLGAEIDIHAAGQDLIFPHHENERAQSVCVHGGGLARFWMHNALVIMNEQKMSKSTGAILRMDDLCAQWPGETLRLALLMTHYRQPLIWTDDTAPQAQNLLDKFYGALRRLKDVDAAKNIAADDVYEALADDLNTPKAFAVLSALARRANSADDPKECASIKAEMLQSGQLLGLLQADPEIWFKRDQRHRVEQIEKLIAARNEARTQKNFARADQIREQLDAMDVILEDKQSETIWRSK